MAIDLPVFSFRVNWREALTERLSFLTNVLSARKGAEQRRRLRNTPRRAVEGDFLLKGSERSFWDLFQNNLAGQDIYAPLFWDMARMTEVLTATVTDRIDFNTQYREFRPGFAILTRGNALDYEIVEIAAVDAGGVDLVDPVTRSWPKGTRLFPLRQAQIEDSGDLRHFTTGVATVTSRLRFIGPNPWSPAADDSPVYLGRPVFLHEPNWVQELAVEFAGDIAQLDNQTGVPAQRDSRGRLMLGQQHRWFLRGREELAGFRDLIYRHWGRRGSFWLPTFKSDLVLVADLDSTDIDLQIENIGFEYTGGPKDGRRYVAIQHGSGTILRQIASVDHLPGSDVETVTLDAPVGLDLPMGQVRRISFADTARFDQDEFEIVHHAGPDGLHEVNAVFRTFRPERTAPEPIYYPIPTAEERTVPCGEEEPGDGCDEEIYNGPLIIQFTVPDPLPPFTGDFENYMQVYITLTIQTNSGETRIVWNSPVVLFNASDEDPPPANTPVLKTVIDPVCGWNTLVTMETVYTPGLVTITIDLDDPHFKFAPNWEEPDAGDTTWWDHPYVYGDWVALNVIGDATGFATDSFSSTATITLDGVAGPPAKQDEMWYVAQGFPPIQNGYRFRFVPSQT